MSSARADIGVAGLPWKSSDEVFRSGIAGLLDVETWDTVYRLMGSVRIRRYSLVHVSRDVWRWHSDTLPGPASWALTEGTVNLPPEAYYEVLEAVRRQLVRYGVEQRNLDFVVTLPIGPVKAAAVQRQCNSAAVFNFLADVGVVPSRAAIVEALVLLSFLELRGRDWH